MDERSIDMKRIFTKIFNYAMEIAAKPKAIYFLFMHSFFESWFFIPIPPDVVLVPMTLSKPKKAWLYAGITLIGSVLGSCVGFAIGFFASIGHLFLILSLRYADASKLAPFGYFEIVTNIIIGYYFFSHFPDSWTFLGLFIII